jgi:MFS family permease
VRVSGETRKTAYSAFLIRILQPPYRNRTLINTLLLFIALTGFWAGSQYLGTAIVTLAAQQGLSTEAPRLAAQGLALLSICTIIGCLMVAPLAGRIGRRGTLAVLFTLMIVGIAGAFGWGYYAHSMIAFFAFIPILGIGGGNFAVFTVWLPEQYPTEIRATAFAFCTTMSRFVAAACTFLVGYGIARAGTIGWPLALTAVPFVFGIWLAYRAPETTDEMLPT